MPLATPLEAWWILTALLAITWFVPLLGSSAFSRVEQFCSRLASRRGFCVLLLFLATMLTRLALLPVFPIQPPRAHDEFSYLLQADMLARGRLAFPPHPMSAYFDTFYVTFHPFYSSIYPPAQAATIAVGYLLGHPWIGVLLGTATMVSAILWMLQGWFPPHWALLGAVLVMARIAIFSYWMNSYWGGSISAVGAALVLGALPRIKRCQCPSDAIFLGLGFAILANSRPFEGLIFCLPVSFALLFWFYRAAQSDRQLFVRRVLLPVSACLLSAAAFMLYHNWSVTGSVLSIPRAVYYKQYLTVSPFVWGRIEPPVHYANAQFDGFFNVWFRKQYDATWGGFRKITARHTKDFWDFYLGPILSLPFLSLPWLIKDRRIRFFLWQFLLCSAGLLAVTWFFPHYAAPLLCALIALLGQAMRHLRRWRFRGRPIGVGWSRVIVALVICQVPACAIQVARHPRDLCCHNTPHNWDRAAVVHQLENTPGLHLVIVRYGQLHNIHAEWVFNAADIDHSKIVWAREIPGLDLAPLLAYYQNRQVWIVEPDETPARLFPYLPQSK